MNQGAPKITSKRQKLEEVGRILPDRFQREHVPASSLISDFNIQTVRPRISVVLSPYVILCYSSHRKRILQPPPIQAFSVQKGILVLPLSMLSYFTVGPGPLKISIFWCKGWTFLKE